MRPISAATMCNFAASITALSPPAVMYFTLPYRSHITDAAMPSVINRFRTNRMVLSTWVLTSALGCATGRVEAGGTLRNGGGCVPGGWAPGGGPPGGAPGGCVVHIGFIGSWLQKKPGHVHSMLPVGHATSQGTGGGPPGGVPGGGAGGLHTSVSRSHV